MFAPLHGQRRRWPAILMVGGTVGLFALAGCGGDGAPLISVSGQVLLSESGATLQTDGETSGDSASGSGAVIGADHDTITTAGHYLAARQALYFNDVGQSADFFLRTLERDASNAALLRQAFLTQYYYGDVERAAALGRQLESLDIMVPLGGEPATALALRNGDWAASVVLADRIAEDSTAIVMAGLIRGWSLVAAGQGDAGISALLEAGRMAIEANTGMPSFFRLHAALMAERLGLLEEASQRVIGLENERLSSHEAIDLAGLHARLGNWQIVDQLIDTQLSRQFNKSKVRAAIRDSSKQLPAVQQHVAGAVVAMALSDGADSSQSMSARLRFALFISPEHDFARLLLAQQLAEFGQVEESLSHIQRIQDGGVYGQLARLAESAVMEDAGRDEEAIALMKAVVEGDPDNDYLFHRLGDSYRRNGQFGPSRDAYMTAMALGRDTGGLHRSLGVALEQLGEAEAAETHLLRAIEIDPGDAYALNYLGYW